MRGLEGVKMKRFFFDRYIYCKFYISYIFFFFFVSYIESRINIY